jgi:Zn-dependent peptidase ImmA (M78 family)
MVDCVIDGTSNTLIFGMQFLIDKAIDLDVGWNERPLGLTELYELCRRFGITVEETPIATGGFYYRVMGRDFIALDSRLDETTRQLVLAHEFAHFLFHSPETGPAANFHRVGRRTRQEIEADAFAICTLMPRPMIEGRTAADLVNDGFNADMAAARFEVLERYGI